MKLIPIQSSMLSHAGYGEKNHELGVIFHTGGLYIYENVPLPIYAGLMKAASAGESVGAYMHKYVIDKYPYRRTNQVGASQKERSSHKTAPKTAVKGKVIPFTPKTSRSTVRDNLRAKGIKTSR